MYHSTRFAAIMVPNETVERVYEVAQRYGANYLVVPGTRRDLEQDLAQNHVGDPRFKRLGLLPYDNRSALYRINLEP